MQTQTTTGSTTNSIIPVKTGKKRGRKPLPFVAKPTPSTLVLTALGNLHTLSFDQLMRQTRLDDSKLGLALSNVIINTKQVYSFSRQGVRYYSLNK